MTGYTPRYSVCTPGDLPRELFATNSLAAALADVAVRAECGEATVVYDWATGLRVNV